MQGLRRTTIAAAFAMSAVVGLAAPASAARPHSYALPGHDLFPEGVAVAGNHYYVTSTNGGAVFTGRLGSPRAHVLLPAGQDGRTVAVGIKATADRLYIAGGPTGYVFVYDRSSGQLVRRFKAPGDPAASFLNDVVVARNGDVYVTDSFRPRLLRIPAALTRSPRAGDTPLPVFVSFRGTPFRYTAGFNANGLVMSPDASAVVVVQTGTGKLFRVDVATRRVSLVSGATLPGGDGLDRVGKIVYAKYQSGSQRLAKVRLSRGGHVATLLESAPGRSLIDPTTVAVADGRLLVVNSQFSAQGGTPVEPFTVSSLSLSALFG